MIIISVPLGCALLAILCPYTRWRSFWTLLTSTLTCRGISIRQRVRLLVYLFLQIAISPVLTVLHYLDEVLFQGHKSVNLNPPVFIVGQPRSGTTLLHRTLSENESLYSLSHFEWRYPFICVWKLVDAFSLRPMVNRLCYWGRTKEGRLANKMHEHYLGSKEEHGVFFEERLSFHYFLFRRFPFPEVIRELSDYGSLSEVEVDRMLKLFLKAVKKYAYYHGSGGFWITKENESVDLYRRLAACFPEARFIFLVRNPDESLKSYRELSIASTKAKTGIDPTRLGGWEQANLAFRQAEFEKVVALIRDIWGTHSCSLVSFEAFTITISDTVRQIMTFLNLEMREQFVAKLAQLQSDQNARDRGYSYSDEVQYCCVHEYRQLALIARREGVVVTQTDASSHDDWLKLSGEF